MAATNANKGRWPAEMVDRLTSLHSDARRLSFSEISRELGAGYSRNAVISKARSLGLPARLGPPLQTRAPTRAAKGNYSSEGAVAGGILNRIKSRLNSDRAPVVALRVVNDAIEQEPLHLAFDNLTSTSCRWPYGDVSPFTFCGCQTLPTKPFCAAHAKRAVQKPISEAERDRRQAHGKTIAAIGRKVSKSRQAFA